LVIYCYPMTGQPNVPLPEGWDQIPGARGCTPQSCSFRDHYQELGDLGAEVIGLSVQTTQYQKEMADRLHLPFPVVSDVQYAFQKALNLPTFEAAGMTLLKRVTLIANQGVIEAVHYPIFPSDSDAPWVVQYLKTHA
jgi:peroxiredoxin